MWYNKNMKEHLICPRDASVYKCNGCEDVAKVSALQVLRAAGLKEAEVVAEHVEQKVRSLQEIEQPVTYVGEIMSCNDRRRSAAELAVQLAEDFVGNKQ